MSAMPKTGDEQRSVKPHVRKILDRHGWFWWSTPMNGFGQTGVADTMAFKNGVLVAIESKFKKGKPSARQIIFLNSITAQQGFAFVVNETTLVSLDQFFSDFGTSVVFAQQQKTVPPVVVNRMQECIKLLTNYPASVEAFAADSKGKRHDVDSTDQSEYPAGLAAGGSDDSVLAGLGKPTRKSR